MNNVSMPSDFDDPGIGGFVAFAGPILRKTGIPDGEAVAGFRVEARHCNPQGICHGGWLSTFADVQIARTALAHLDGARYTVRTVHLGIDFLFPARIGEWVEGRARIVRRTKRMVFLEGEAQVDGEGILRMNAILSIAERKTPGQPTV